MLRSSHARSLMFGVALSFALATTGATAATVTVENLVIGDSQSMLVVIPKVELDDASLSAEDVKALVRSDPASALDTLATLSASAVRIPEIRMEFPPPPSGGERFTMTFTGFEITEVADGVAGSVEIGGGQSTVSGHQPVSIEVGAMSATSFNLPAIIALYGGGGDASMEKSLLYSDFEFAGAKMSGGDGFSCEIKGMRAESASARPFSLSIGDVMKLAQDAEKGTLPPGAIAKLVGYYADVFDAIETSPAVFDGMDCSVKQPDGAIIALKMGEMQIDGFGGMRYPGVSMADFEMTHDKEGHFRAASVVFKGMDLGPVFETLKAAGENVNEAWFQENARKLIPVFDGFSVEGLDFDFPDTTNPSRRISFAVDAVDVTLGAYVNGIPTDIDLSGSGIKVPLPADSQDETVAMLKALGYPTLNLSYALKGKWDESAQTIAIDELTVSGDGMGSVTMTGLLGNATQMLFNDDLQAVQAGALFMTAKSVTLDVVDEGLAPKALAMAAQMQGKTPAEMKTEIGNMAGGMAMMMLKGAPEAKALADAITAFVNGAPKLSVELTAKSPKGVGALDLPALQKDPSELTKKVTIKASN